MKLNEKIYYYRKRAKLSQEELAAQVGVSRQAVSKWELGDATPELDKLAQRAEGCYDPRPVLRGCDCHLSGVENQCRAMREKGAPPEEVAAFCLRSILAAVAGMTVALQREYGPLPLIYAGGVMSNSLLRRELTARFDGAFAPPAFSADNAAGIAFLFALTDGAL